MDTELELVIEELTPLLALDDDVVLFKFLVKNSEDGESVENEALFDLLRLRKLENILRTFLLLPLDDLDR